MNRRQKQKMATRQKIRSCAKELFSQQGYEATTSRQIAEQAGVALGTLFVHFPSKKAILIDILYEDVETAVFTAFNTIPQNAPTLTKLLYLARSLYSYYLSQIDLSRALLQHSVFEAGETADFDTQIATFVQAITKLLQEGQANNEIALTKDAHTMATAFMAVYFFVLMGLLRAETPDLEKALQQLETLTLTIIQ